MEITEIIRRAGGVSLVAKTIGRHHSSVMEWRRVPAEHVLAVAEMSGLTPGEIRPDVFGAPTKQVVPFCRAVSNRTGRMPAHNEE
jgi:DNA-binding transcriptional regulator YdaS (Cro superfamily)